MDWILDNLQIVVIIALVLGSMVKGIVERALGKKQEEAESWEPPEYEAAEQEAPPVRRPSVPPPLPQASAPARVEKKTAAAWDGYQAQQQADALQHQQELAERLRLIRDAKEKSSAPPRGRGTPKKKQVKTAPVAALTLKSRLRDPSEVRRAVVLREILGPPVGLR